MIQYRCIRCGEILEVEIKQNHIVVEACACRYDAGYEDGFEEAENLYKRDD